MKYVFALAVVLVLLGLSNAASFKTKALLNRFQALHRRGDDGHEGEDNRTPEQKRFHAIFDAIEDLCEESEIKTGKPVCDMIEYMNEQFDVIPDYNIQEKVEKVGIENMQKFECLLWVIVSELLEIPAKPSCLQDTDPSDTVNSLYGVFDDAASLDRKRNTDLKNLLNELAQYIHK